MHLDLFDVFNAKPNTQASQSLSQVVALRLYTTVAFLFMNNPLQDEDQRDAGQACPLAVTTSLASRCMSQHVVGQSHAGIFEGFEVSARIHEQYHICCLLCTDEGIKKLWALHHKTETMTLWRGMQNVEVTENFRQDCGTGS